MSIFLCNKTTEPPSTASTRSHNHPVQTARQKTVTPFFCQEKSLSPARRRVDQSPLQGALSIAIKKITSHNESQDKQHPQVDARECQKKLNWTESEGFIERECQVGATSVANLKNILQQFMQSLYCQAERQIYSRFNSQMKRMVIKYRDTERMLKKIQQKLTINADVIELEAKLRIKDDHHAKQIVHLEDTISRLTRKIELQAHEKHNSLCQLMAISRENQRLKINAEKYESILLRQLQQGQRIHQPTSKRSSVQSNNFHTTKNASFSNLLTNHYTHTQTEHFLDSSGLSHNNSQLLNLNRLQPSLSPVSTKGKKCRSTLQNKQKPIDLEIASELTKSRLS